MGIHMYAAGGACSTNIRSSTVIFGPDTARRVSGPNIGWYVNRGEQPHPFGPDWAWYGDAWSRVEPFPARQYFIPDHPSRPRYIRYRRQWAEPSWVPAWVPMIVPPLAPQPAPVAPPYREIPRLDPSPDFPEMPQRGNEFAPSPRVPTFPWPADWPAYWGDWFPDVDAPPLVVPKPAPGAKPGEPPPVAPPDPRRFPIQAVIEWMAAHNPDGSAWRNKADSRPKPPTARKREGKEKKIRSAGLASLLAVAARWQNALADYNDMVDALYQALPKSCRDKHSSYSGRRYTPAAKPMSFAQTRGIRGSRGPGATGGSNVGRRRRGVTTGSARKWNYRNTTDEGLNLVAKQVAIMKCWDRMDVPKAVQNVAREIMEDILGAGSDALRNKAAVKSGQPKVKYDIRSPGLEF